MATGRFASSGVGVVKTMQQLLNEINQVKNDVEASIKTLKRIDTGRKKAAANRDRSVEGRTQIRNLNERINDLQNRMGQMTKESDPTWPAKTFDKSKQDALKTLSSLSNKLNQLDRHLEKATGATHDNTQPVLASTESAEGENTKGIGALVRRLSFGDTKKTTSLSNSDDEESDEEDAVVRGTQELQSSSQGTKDSETSSDESEENEEDDMNDNRQLLHQLQNHKSINDHSNDSHNSDHRFRSSTPLRMNEKPSTVKVDSTSSPISRKTSVSSTSTSRKKTSSPPHRTVIPRTENDDDSDDDTTFEDDDDSEDELKKLHDSTEQESTRSSDQTIEDEPNIVNAHVQELRMGKYPPGTQFRVTNNLAGLQTGDLTIHKDEILILIEQQPDDWWLFENPQTEQQGLVPINHIQLQSKTSDHGFRHRVKATTSASTLVDVFKTNNFIPSGFIPSELAPLTEHNQYKLSYTLIPKMTESNFAFNDLHWRYDTDQIYTQQVKYQKILTIKKCLKIPRIKSAQIRVLNRCIRVCLYDGLEIISNIHSSRARLSDTIKEDDLTEDWYFVANDDKTFIDEQSEFLIRSNEYHPSKQIYLLIELSQFCESKLDQEKCEIGCGWIILPFDDNQLSKNFNKLLRGGYFHQTNILLDSQYKQLHSEGLAGKLDRYKRARLRFSIQSREKHVDLLYDNLPLTSMIVPMNLVQTIVFYRNELAYQLQKRSHSNGLSTAPVDSIFLSTFYQTLEQADLIYALQRLYHRHKEIPVQEQREEFIKIYESSIYPLLFYRLLPPYDFHDISSINERRKIISAMINKQLSTKQNNQIDILALLLDPNLTDKWTPFTTDEICFSLQKYVHDFTSRSTVS